MHNVLRDSEASYAAKSVLWRVEPILTDLSLYDAESALGRDLNVDEPRHFCQGSS